MDCQRNKLTLLLRLYHQRFKNSFEKNAKYFIPLYKFVIDETVTIICDFIGKLEDTEQRVTFSTNMQ